MKGKIAFVLGATVGYVLGTRAGRERYEQIKRGAQNLWNTEPVQRGVGAVRGAAQDKVEHVKASVVRAGKEAFAALTQVSDGASAPSRQTASQPRSSSSPKSQPADSAALPVSGADDLTVTEGGTA